MQSFGGNNNQGTNRADQHLWDLANKTMNNSWIFASDFVILLLLLLLIDRL